MVALLVMSVTVHAQDFYVAAGPSIAGLQPPYLGAAVFVGVAGTAPNDGRLHLRPVATLGWLAPRDSRRVGLNHSAWVAAGGVRIDLPGGHWFASGQIAAVRHPTDALSSPFEFMYSGGWEDGRFILVLRHISNAGVIGQGANLGETMALVGVRW